MKVNDYFHKVYVVNLDRRTDRMEKLDAQLNKLGIEYERVSAVDGKALGIDPIIAGTISHQKILAANPQVRMLILEDDALFVDDFNEKFEEYMKYLPANTDIFYLGALLTKNIGKVEDIGNKYWFRQIFSTGSHAYSIHPARVQYFADKLSNYDSNIDLGLMQFSVGYQAVIAQPNLVTQFPSFSDLRLQEVDDF